MPFAAYYIQDLGVRGEQNVLYWMGWFGASAPLALAIMGPIWGMLADRYGRRLMMLRAGVGAAVVLYGMGSVNTVGWLIALRVGQGLFTGTMTAATTLVSVATPARRRGFALGTLCTAQMAGIMAGKFIGSHLAAVFGYADTFKVGGGLLLLATLLIWFGVKEQFVPPAPVQATGNPQRGWHLPQLMAVAPLLLLIMGVALARNFDRTVLPVFIQSLVGGRGNGEELWTGRLALIEGAGAILAGLYLGRLADRVSAPAIGRWSAAGACLFLLLMGFCETFSSLTTAMLVLFLARFGMWFCAAGLDPVLQVWLSRSTSQEKRGAVFGWATTARALAWMAAPLMSTYLAAATAGLPLGGLRSVFYAAGILFIVLVPLIGWAARRVLANGGENAAAGTEP